MAQSIFGSQLRHKARIHSRTWWHTLLYNQRLIQFDTLTTLYQCICHHGPTDHIRVSRRKISQTVFTRR